MFRTRLLGCAAAVTMSAATITLSVLPGHAAAAGSLAQLAEANGRYFGTALTQGNLSNPTLTAVAGAQFDMVTPGNEMKWDTTEPANGTFNFGPGDQIVAFAKAHGDRVRGHNLVWDSQLPSWVSSLPLTQVQSAMETHITTEVTHYGGQLYAWDVVNEPFNEDGTLKADVFERAFGGSGYIADALRTAHAADPTAKLYLNDFNIEGENAKSNAMFNLAQSLLAQGVPLNGIGFESHFILGQVPASMQANMARFAALGLDVAVTELDDRMQLPATSANLTQQASEFAAVVRDCLGVARCVGVTQWGVGDADSWIPGAFPGMGAATMFDQNYQPKPAFNSVIAALGGTTTTPPPPPSGGFCHVTYTTSTEWVGGFVANMTLANPGTTAINGWRVTFTFGGDQHITNAWNATVTQSGSAVTAVNASFDATVAPGGSVSFGFQGTWTTSDAVPTAFSVNGTRCS